MTQLLHSGSVRPNWEPWPSPLFPVPVRLSLSLRFPRESFPSASWQHQPKTFPCLYHHWSSTVSRTTLNPRHRVPRKLLTAWKETKNLQEKHFMSLRGLTWVSLKKTLKGIILCYAGKQTLKRLAENPLMCLRGGDDNWDSSFFRTGQGDSSLGAGVLSRKM